MKQNRLLEITIDDLYAEDAILVEEARNACSMAYAPYSNFHVGAALLLENGEIIKGANIENASYPVGICAERSTIATAHNLYPGTPIISIALAAKTPQGEFTEGPVTPCGMCRQVIAECEQRFQRNIRILMTSKDKVTIADSINSLLPYAFA